MKETRADTRNALLQATGLHVLLFALMFAGLHWTRSNVVEPTQGDVIEADLIDPSALSASMQRALKRDPAEFPRPVAEPTPVPPQPVPDPLPDPQPTPVAEELPPPPVTEPDKIDQQKVQRDAPTPDPAVAQREQEAKQRQQQVDLDAQKQDAQKQEAQKQKALADIRKQRERASRELSMAEQRAQQMADAKAQQAPSRAPPPGDPNSRAVHNASYVAALQAAILRQWIRPESVHIGQQCQVLIKQIPGGEVVDVQISPECPYDELGRRSVEAAVMKASPLPYAGYEDVFSRNPVFTFRAEDQ